MKHELTHCVDMCYL